jgi:hypothetical protein
MCLIHMPGSAAVISSCRSDGPLLQKWNMLGCLINTPCSQVQPLAGQPKSSVVILVGRRQLSWLRPAHHAVVLQSMAVSQLGCRVHRGRLLHEIRKCDFSCLSSPLQTTDVPRVCCSPGARSAQGSGGLVVGRVRTGRSLWAHKGKQAASLTSTMVLKLPCVQQLAAGVLCKRWHCMHRVKARTGYRWGEQRV